MANVCVSNNFTVTDGVLDLSRLGDADCEAWPFTSDPEDVNGLKCDPAGGLWVAPEKQILRVGHSHNQAPNISVGTGTVTGTPLVANITNPSAHLTMLLVLTVSLYFRVGQSDSSTGAFSIMRVSVTRDNPTPTYVDIGTNARPTGVIGGVIGWLDQWTDTITALLTPGQTATYRVTPQMAGAAGTSNYLNSTERIDGIGITL